MTEARRRLVLVRHGQTAWNAIGRGQGHSDVELDDQGHEQAALAAAALATYTPVVLWSSDLARCRQTTAYIAKETGLSATYDARLREFDLGQRTGLTMAEFEAQHPAEYADFAAGHFTAVPGGETTEAVERRMGDALAEVLAGVEPGETAMVVAHGAALKVAVMALLGWPAELASGLQALGNCRHAVLEELTPGGRLRLVGYNLSM